jgi:hypothetical protein
MQHKNRKNRKNLRSPSNPFIPPNITDTTRKESFIIPERAIVEMRRCRKTQVILAGLVLTFIYPSTPVVNRA